MNKTEKKMDLWDIEPWRDKGLARIEASWTESLKQSQDKIHFAAAVNHLLFLDLALIFIQYNHD